MTGPKMNSRTQMEVALDAAYIELLAFYPPRRRHTLAGQGLLCQLRDALAREQGWSRENVQNACEAKAQEIYKQAVLKGVA